MQTTAALQSARPALAAACPAARSLACAAAPRRSLVVRAAEEEAAPATKPTVIEGTLKCCERALHGRL